MKKLWHYRYEVDPKLTYDMLAKKLKRSDTQCIVDALTTMRGRESLGKYKFTPIKGVNIYSKDEDKQK